MRLPPTKVETEYVKFEGGIDRITPALSIKPGFAIDALNYEPRVFGGYQRIDGYERIDGRAAPSDADYYYVVMNASPSMVVGMGIIGDTSGATAVIAYISDSFTNPPDLTLYVMVALARVVGTFTANESVSTGGGGLPFLLTMTYTRTSLSVLVGSPALGAFPSPEGDARALAGAADVYRDLIGFVPGSGPVRGVNMLKGVLYAFRDTYAGTACEMWKATTLGWVNVPLGLELAFTSGGVYFIAEGDTVTGAISGATAVVKRVALQSGTFAGGTAAGRLIFAAKTGVFVAEELNVGANLSVATIAGDATAITLLPGGHFEFDNYNFTGSTDTFRMYGCDGKNRGFESDGTIFVPIVTGMTVDTPTHVHCHKKQLFFSFRGSSQNSGIGLPYQWTAVTGAAEIGIGDDITGYSSQTGDALAIFARNRSDQLLGSSVSDFVLKPLSAKAGAIPFTVQTIVGTYYLDDAGVRLITRTQDFGNFDDDPISERIQPIIDLLRDKAIASSVYRQRKQYRLYANDGSGIIFTMKSRPTLYGSIAQDVVGVTTFQYLVNPSCTCSGEDVTGKDVVFFGAADGYVYQGDKGSSFDGEEIEAALRLPFNHSKSPRTRKRYRKAVMEMESVGYSEIRFNPEFTYGDSDTSDHRTQTAEVVGAGNYWDVGIWEQFAWDARLVAAPEFSIEGTGTNLSMLFYSKSAIDLGHTLQGSLIHFSQRRQAR